MAGLSSKSGFLRRHCVFERLESRTLLATVAGRFIAHDDPSSAGAFDIATDKQPLFPGEAATFANYTSDVRGIRRLVIDLAGRSNASALLASDFQFRMGNDSHFTNAAAAPLPFITTRNHAGDDGSDRVTLTWEPADLRNTWLEVTIHPTRRTELSGSDVFYFGNAVGETGDSLRHAVVNVVDEDLVRQHAGSGRGNVDARFDFNRDRWVDGSDVAIVRDFRTNFATSLALIAPPAPETSQPSRIHYDYPIDKKGTLDGGFIIADQSDPLQQNVVSRPSARHTPRHPSTTLVSHGPSDNRIDLVFVGDGYTAAQMPSYASHVNSIYPTFFNEAPLDEYYSYFNIHRVDVASLESGVDNDPTQGVQKNTALDMAFWCAGTERLLCINTSKASLAARSAPAVDQILAVANSTMYGGAGYASNNLGTLSGANAAAIEVALHEFGHSFADLADEYFYTGTTYYGGEPSAPNVSKLTAASMAAQQKKWHRWLDEPNVSTFEGAMYNEKGLYRPTSNSKMRTLGRPFEQVNTEQFVLSVYKTVDPIDGATAPGSYQDGHVFFVDPMDPMSHRLDVQWYLDGSPIDGATAETLDTSTLTLPAGSYSLSVQVVDNTAMVRDESQRTALMTETRTWTLVSTQAGVVARHVFYNKSVFDNHTRGPDPADDLAIDNSKAPLLPGGTASFANYTSYSRGLNGVMIDVQNLASTSLPLTDFVFQTGNHADPSTWSPAPNPMYLSVRPGAGLAGSDRITIIWNDGAIHDQWLEVRLLANGNTGLATDDLFYFGNAIGETGNIVDDTLVNAFDVAAIRDHANSTNDPAPVTDPHDLNRDTRVDATDILLAATHANSFLSRLQLISVPSPPPLAELVSSRDWAARVGGVEPTSAASLRPLATRR